jgi:pyridoxamine 5'-phosphate oxidase
MTETQLTDSDFTEADEPIRLFAEWLEDADPESETQRSDRHRARDRRRRRPAQCAHGAAQGFRRAGFVFYTNFESAKGTEILASMKAAMCFHWKSLRRQVRCADRSRSSPTRRPTPITRRARAAAASAPGHRSSRARWRRGSRWKRRWPNTPRATPSARSRAPTTGPASASCRQIEFWHDRPFRLHDRVRFERDGDGWRKVRLYP